MHKKIMLTIIIFIFCISFVQVNATNISKDINKSESAIVIEDDADILTPKEEQELRKQMVPLTEYGYVVFKSTNTNYNSTPLKYIQNYYYSKFGNKSGVAFYIDMKGREICACASGGLDNIITSSKCDTIMDNVYRYASQKKYYECSRQAFLQMNKLLSGEKIAETMKYFCNAIIAIMLSLFVNYGFYIIISKNKKASNKEMINECVTSLEHSEIIVNKTGTHSEYSPVRDRSSSGSSSSGRGRRRRFLWKWWKPQILKQYCYSFILQIDKKPTKIMILVGLKFFILMFDIIESLNKFYF